MNLYYPIKLSMFIKKLEQKIKSQELRTQIFAKKLKILSSMTLISLAIISLVDILPTL